MVSNVFDTIFNSKIHEQYHVNMFVNGTSIEHIVSMNLKWAILRVFEGYFKVIIAFSNERGRAACGFFEFPGF